MRYDKETKKDTHERFHLEVFSTLQHLPGDELPRTDHLQRPDFRYQCGDLIIGIEHTEIKRLYAGQGKPSLAELKGLHRGIVQKAGQLAAEQGLPPLNVKVLFHDHFYRYSKDEKKKVVQGLLHAVTKNLDKIMQMETGNSIRIDPPSPFVGISNILVTPGTAYGKVWLTNHRWEVLEPGTVRRGFVSELQERITKKSRIINEYLKTCDKCWLLVVADRTKADQKFEFTPEMQIYIYESEFEKTFYLEMAERFFTELKTTRPTRANKSHAIGQ